MTNPELLQTKIHKKFMRTRKIWHPLKFDDANLMLIWVALIHTRSPPRLFDNPVNDNDVFKDVTPIKELNVLNMQGKVPLKVVQPRCIQQPRCQHQCRIS